MLLIDIDIESLKMGIKITASRNVCSACKLLPKMIQYFCVQISYSGIYQKPFSVGSTGRFFGTNIPSPWCILSIGGNAMEIILFLIIIILSITLISTKLGLSAYVAWVEENHFKQPSDKDMQRLISWCARKYVRDLFRKS